jgi:hypothetical protein
LAAVILEVLGGIRLPSEAATILGVSLPRYYALESRALEGLVEACEPRGKGRVASPGRALEVLKRENERLQGEVSRKQALLRAVQRTMGVPAVPTNPARKDKRRRRKPSVRALKAVSVLKSEPASGAGEVKENRTP